jgi:choline monooxygenase
MITSTVRQLCAELASLRELPREQAKAMSAAYYTSPEFLALERDVLFRKQWVCLGHVGEVPQPGDFFTTDLIDEPLLVVRDTHGDVRVLSNVCRHRGNTIAQGSGHATRLVCGYHAWTYGLDGQLLAAPRIAEGSHFDRRSCRLPQFRSELWHGFIFVNLDATAAPLGPTLAGTEPYIRNYRSGERHFLYGTEEVWNTNWKCLAENFMEGYHLSPMHAKTLHSITPTSLCEKLPDGPAFTGYRANFSPSCPERGPYPEALTEQERRSDVFYCIYPSFVVGICPHFTIYMCLRPLSADTVGIRWGVTGTVSERESSEVKSYVKFCEVFCAEDRATLERLQKGLKSRYYSPGPLAPDNFEGTIWDMLQYSARHLGRREHTST